MPGRVLSGRYQVQDKIGTGGMATVFRGVDQTLGRTVAIKTMLPQYAADPSFAARFKQEAQAAAALQSPYIVSVYDWGQDGDTYYIIMEYLRGTDLKSGIRKHGALDCKKVAQIGSQIAQALSVAHRHDIIHRDIKPQNIMVQPDGNIKVMDFGIARAKNSHLTTDNSVLGTAHYVSPEQTQGHELGPTTDIYSLGVVMYEAATGRVPFDGDDAVTVALKQVTEQPVPPSQVNPAVDPTLESIILKCMEKDPANRYQTADELYRALRDYLTGRMVQTGGSTAVLHGSPMVARPSATATLPRNVQTTSTHMRQISATQQAEEEERARQGKRRRKTFLIVVAVLLAIAAAAYAVVSMLGTGSQTYPIPNLLGLTQDEAQEQVEKDGHFSISSVKESYSDTVAEGQVMDQYPSAGRLMDEGTQIEITISKGPEPAATVTVPDLTNLTPSQVDEALAKANLKGQAGDSVYDSNIEVGKVAQQEPVGGTTAKAGDTVTYHLSQGVEKVDVPSVVGQSQSDATSALETAGFTVNVTTSSSSVVTKGYVISQTPSSGQADKGSSVTITVSSGPETKTVPNVIGESVGSAESTLINAGFKYYVEYVSSDSVASGVVISYSPTSGAAGSTVTIKVSSGSSSSHSGSGTGDGSSTTGGETGGGTGHSSGTDD